MDLAPGVFTLKLNASNVFRLHYTLEITGHLDYVFGENNYRYVFLIVFKKRSFQNIFRRRCQRFQIEECFRKASFS